MDVDKKPCEENTASTQSSTVNRTTEDEPERIVKASCSNSLFIYDYLLIFVLLNYRIQKFKLLLLLLWQQLLSKPNT